jgi:hypothetical protein
MRPSIRTAVKNKYQRKDRKSNHIFEVVGERDLVVPLPMAEVRGETQAQMEELTGQTGMQFLRAIMENEVAGPVGPPHRPVFGGQEIALEWPRVRTREGKAVELNSHGQSRQEAKLQKRCVSPLRFGSASDSTGKLPTFPRTALTPNASLGEVRHSPYHLARGRPFSG